MQKFVKSAESRLIRLVLHSPRSPGPTFKIFLNVYIWFHCSIQSPHLHHFLSFIEDMLWTFWGIWSAVPTCYPRVWGCWELTLNVFVWVLVVAFDFLSDFQDATTGDFAALSSLTSSRIPRHGMNTQQPRSGCCDWFDWYWAHDVCSGNLFAFCKKHAWLKNCLDTELPARSIDMSQISSWPWVRCEEFHSSTTSWKVS